MADIFKPASKEEVGRRIMASMRDVILKDFAKIFEIAKGGYVLSERDVLIRIFLAPHTPPRKLLPRGKVGVSIFFWDHMCLLVDKIHPYDEKRYATWHYNPKISRRTLASKMLRDLPSLGRNYIGTWVKKRVNRIDIFFPLRYGRAAQELLQAFLVARLRPRFRS